MCFQQMITEQRYMPRCRHEQYILRCDLIADTAGYRDRAIAVLSRRQNTSHECVEFKSVAGIHY